MKYKNKREKEKIICKIKIQKQNLFFFVIVDFQMFYCLFYIIIIIFFTKHF